MSKEEPPNPLDQLREQIQDALRSGRVHFAPPGAVPPAAPAAVAAAPEGAGDDIEAVLQRIRGFSLKPREVRDYLDRFVIQQQEAKKVLAVAICDHYNHVRQCLENPRLQERAYHKQNILLLGPTGVGKTFLMRHIARLIGVPFVKADATKFSETGYVGADVEDLVRDLYKAAGQNAELARYGIIYIDEIDKIAATANMAGGKDVSGRGVQINLLKLMEETDVSLFSPTDMMAQMSAVMEASRGGRQRPRTLNTRHVLFIVSGAFDKLAESVKKRLEASSIGFARTAEMVERQLSWYLHRVETSDLIKFGYEPEFVGRLPVRVACDPLGEQDLADILLHSEDNLLDQYKSDFRGYGIELRMTTEAIAEIARRAHVEGTGARGLMTVFERVFRYFKFELPSTGIASIEVSRETISDPAATLKHLLKEHAHLRRNVLRAELDAFAARFAETHGIALDFAEEACEVLIDISVDRDKTIRAVCEERFKDFEHGLKIVARNTAEERFRVTAAMVRDPDGELSRLVVASFATAQQRQAAEDAPTGGAPSV
jgi:endopeptidase Clp ATP-binding regulatory subunit ClpX